MKPMKFADIPLRVQYIHNQDVFHLVVENGTKEIRYTLTPQVIENLEYDIYEAKMEKKNARSR